VLLALIAAFALVDDLPVRVDDSIVGSDGRLRIGDAADLVRKLRTAYE
jgi:hypothetical protein